MSKLLCPNCSNHSSSSNGALDVFSMVILYRFSSACMNAIVFYFMMFYRSSSFSVQSVFCIIPSIYSQISISQVRINGVWVST